MAGRVVISTSTIGEETRNDVLSEIIGNDIYADTKKSGGKCHKKFLAEDVLSEEQNHRDSYRSSLTGKVVTRCLNNRICKCFYNELKYWRKKLYDSKNARYRIRLWNTLQCLWFSALVLMIMTMLRLSNQIGASQENIEMKHMKALVSSAPRFTSHMGHSLPDVYSNFADLTSGFQKQTDIPFFWHIPRSLGATMVDIMGRCMHLVLASNVGAQQGHDKDTSLQVINMGHSSYVNVDTNTLKGIERAKKLRLASSGLAQVIISSRIYDAASIFTNRNPGRMFMIMRHPVDRAASLFHYTQDTVWRRNNVKQYKNIPILDYFKSGLGESNWMTRFLTNNLRKELTNDDLDIAKEILRRKCLIGLASHKSESFERFQVYFKWNIPDGEAQEYLDKKLNWAWPLKHRHDLVEEGNDVWNAIVAMNQYDMQLYSYAQQLFQEQASLFQ